MSYPRLHGYPVVFLVHNPDDPDGGIVAGAILDREGATPEEAEIQRLFDRHPERYLLVGVEYREDGARWSGHSPESPNDDYWYLVDLATEQARQPI